MTLAATVAVASFLPLRGRALRRLPIAVWGMAVAHFGVAVALFGMAADSAFTIEKLSAANVGETTVVGPWQVRLNGVEPVAGPNWTALEAEMTASYDGGAGQVIHPQCSRPANPPC
jgi:cytochrome c-type biogenesis protein CcmF